MKRLVVLISNKGTGTNLQAIIDGIKSGRICATIDAVIADTKEALGLERAKKNKLPIKVVSKKENLLNELKKINPDYICLTGWKQIILDEVIEEFPDRILNTHPGLIPDEADGSVNNPDGTPALWNKGKLTDQAIQNFLDNNMSYAGCTNHFLSHEFDFGPVLGRCFEKVKKGDTVESLYSRLKIKENKLYIEVLSKLCKENDLTVLVVDGGGRGATLVDAYGKSKKVTRILAVPGNDLMQINTKKPVSIFPHLKTTSISEILEIAKKENVDLVDVAQDNAIAVGLSNELQKNAIRAFGASREAGRLEWDKAWARRFMDKYKIPSPRHFIFNSTEEGVQFIKKHPGKSWFVKAAGLAEGKGVIPGKNDTETIAAIKQMNRFGLSGETFLLEEWLVGEEFSAFSLCDGDSFKIAGFAQDHKRVFDKDEGPNTGGMGSVSDPLIVDAEIKKQVNEIFKKAVDGMKKEKHPYKGILYLGGMVVKGQVKVIEFNSRWGDPEAEVIIPSMQTDMIEIADAIIFNKLKDCQIKVDNKVRIAVAAVAKGYPMDYSAAKGKKISGMEKLNKMKIKIYGAGIKKIKSHYVVNGGRIFYIVAEGKNILEASGLAYKAMSLISIEGENLHYRTDIGWRDIERLNNDS